MAAASVSTLTGQRGLVASTTRHWNATLRTAHKSVCTACRPQQWREGGRTGGYKGADKHHPIDQPVPTHFKAAGFGCCSCTC